MFHEQQDDVNIDSQETDEAIFSEGFVNDQNRLINPDGNFNIEKKGLTAANFYESVLSMSWTWIIVSFFLIYFFMNAVFALVFMWMGPESIEGLHGETWLEKYVEIIFFSIQTFTTVGYGHLSPSSIGASFFASFIAFVGLITFALLTGLSYAKFTKPMSRILFSDKLLIAPNPYMDNKPSLQFRVVNTNDNQIIDLQATVTLTWLVEVDGVKRRKFRRLDLELDNIHLFPLNWTVVHNLDEKSPLKGLRQASLKKRQMELLILIRGFDDTYSQTIHSKHSYCWADIIYGARFLPMYDSGDSHTILHLDKIHDYETYTFA